MRPSSSGESPSSAPRSRKSSIADHGATAALNANTQANIPTTFFMRSEKELEEKLENAESGKNQDEAKPSNGEESVFGVQSLEDALASAFGDQDVKKRDALGIDGAQGSRDAKRTDKPRHRRFSSTSSKASSGRHPESLLSSPVRKNKRKISPNTSSASPPNIAFPSIPASAMPSTPKSCSVRSLKLSDEDSNADDVASQVITSSGEEDEEGRQDAGASSGFPELVMPSIQMPTRRPFTTRGKAMGKLKVLVAGEAGVGKSTLIRSILQHCDDIVHVDPHSPSQSLSQSGFSHSTTKAGRPAVKGRTSRISEIYASTKSYPSWWTELEESRLRRRKSSTDAVLERNICFVDTPGFTPAAADGSEQIMVVEYVESLLRQTSSVGSMDDSDAIGVVGGSGGVQIDLVLYLLKPNTDISTDIQFMQQLSALTNVLPVITKSDTATASEIVAIKTSILARLQTTAIRPFFFGKPIEDALLSVQGLPIIAASAPTPLESSEYPFSTPTYPYAVSSTAGPDTDTMDASLLMSPDYVQPLLPSELTTLINQVFDPESIAWLRHSAAKKFLAWRSRTRTPAESFLLHNRQQQSLGRSSVSGSSAGLGVAMHASATSIFSAASPSGVLVPRASSPFYLSDPNSTMNMSNLQSPTFLASSPSLCNTQPDDNLTLPPDFSLTRYTNNINGGAQTQEFRVAKWATDLQRSLRNERDRYENLQRNERAKWLLDRVGEEVREGNIVSSPTSGSPRAEWAVIRKGSRGAKEKYNGHEDMTRDRRYGNGVLDSRDPLGICRVGDRLRRRGAVVVKVLGGVSVIGAVVVAVCRALGWGMDIGFSVPSQGMWNWLTGKGSEV